MDDFNLNKKELLYFSLIFKEREGTISASDAAELLEWRSSNPANNSLYQKMQQLEGKLDLLKVYKQLNTETSLKTLKGKIQNHKIAQNRHKHLIVFSRWAAVAACFTLLVSGVFYLSHRLDTVTLENIGLESKNFVLPDGSKITLNSNTLVTYSEKKFDAERRLILVRGECFLDVLHDKTKPFSIHYKDVAITDIGTAFNVRLTPKKIEVAVNTGRVEVNPNSGTTAIDLNAGESASYLFSAKKLEKSKILDVNYKAYADHIFLFNESTLLEVVDALTKVFHQKIVLVDPSLHNKRLTAEFKNQSLKDILQVVSKSLNVKITTRQKVTYVND